MADSSYEKGLSELSKMKVADLKVELKQRGLPTTGNKIELVERLQLAIHDSALSLDETTDEILDEDAVLGDEEIEELASKPDSQIVDDKKRKLSTDSNPTAKKIILNRNSIIEDPRTEEKNTEEAENTVNNAESEKKVIKLSQLGVKERLEMRAKKFGVSLSETAKKEARGARFNSANENNSNSAASVKTPVTTSYETLKKRAERFGTSASETLEKAELQERIERRKARFGEVQPLQVKKTFSKYTSGTNRVKYVK